MTVFNDYARYYNLLYRDKDYNSEVAYIHGLIQSLKPSARSILNIGCGTGRHDNLLTHHGYTIQGIDASETMIGLASEIKIPGVLEFEIADARSYRSQRKYDVVISLFHVINYQTSNKSLLDFFETAASHLTPGGIFLFDSWYGPALLSDKPYEKTKCIENDELKIVRKTIPSIDYNQNIANIRFDMEVIDKHYGSTSVFSEIHPMRYLFYPEIQLLASLNNFTIVKFSKWMSDEEPGMNSWYVLYGLIKG